MLEILQKHIKTNMAQYTNIFNLETMSITAHTQFNEIKDTGLNGEYTLSTGLDTEISSNGCINDTFNFTGGNTTTGCFFGDDIKTHTLNAQKVNVGTAIKKELAIAMIIDEKIPNCIIVYLDSMRNAGQGFNGSICEDLTLSVEYNIGVMFKVDARQMENIGCVNTDSVFINSVLGAKKKTSTLIRFDSVGDRFYAGKYYCVDYKFNYKDTMNINDIIIQRVKNFNKTFNLEIKQKGN